MACVSDDSLKHLVWRLRRLRNQKLATEILWLAADQRLEWLPDGSIAFWTRSKEVLAYLKEGQKTPVRVKLPNATWFAPTALAPHAGPAAWCAVNPKAIISSRKAGKNKLHIRVQELAVLLGLEKEPAQRTKVVRRKALGRTLLEKSLPVTGTKPLSKSLVALLDS